MNTVEFPGLNLTLDINREAFSIFGIYVYWYGIIISLAFLLVVLLGVRNSKKNGINPDNLIDLIIFGTVSGIIFARLYYVIFKWEDFRDNWLEILNLRNGGLAIYGAIIGMFLSTYIYCRIKKLRFLKIFDFAVPYIALAQGIGRWGNFFNQEAFGTNTTLPWGMKSDATYFYLLENSDRLAEMGIKVNPELPVHPTFLYESLADIAVFFFLIWFTKRKKREGEVFFLYLFLYGIARFFIEALRTDSLMLGSIRVSQLVAFILSIAAIVLFFVNRNKPGMLYATADMNDTHGIGGDSGIADADNSGNGSENTEINGGKENTVITEEPKEPSRFEGVYKRIRELEVIAAEEKQYEKFVDEQIVLKQEADGISVEDGTELPVEDEDGIALPTEDGAEMPVEDEDGIALPTEDSAETSDKDKDKLSSREDTELPVK